jgi:hypothetical protein
MRSPENPLCQSHSFHGAHLACNKAAYPVEPTAEENGQQQAHLARCDGLPQLPELLPGRRLALNDNGGAVGSLRLVRRRQAERYRHS